TVAEPVHVFAEPGQCPVRMVALDVRSGCADTVVKIVEVFKLIEHLYIPNVFTPNGDGVNDLFTVQTRGFERIEMQIFDRWGTMVFSGANDWNGKYLNNGENCPAGTYFYVVKAYRRDGRLFHRTGGVTLTR
ncbi:MAG: gliding motility-associated C-terminal domain-containing protein, partial [Bacteroidia bacterium]|nr:gliding motility-associated C-terminal domain-containing protein [Bacteroidia bacterium]